MKSGMVIGISDGNFIAENGYRWAEQLKQLGWDWDPIRMYRYVPADDYFAAAPFAAHFTKSARTVLRDLKEEAFRRIAESKAMESDFHVPVPADLSLFPFQRAGVEFMFKHPKSILGDEMGLGKTVQIIGLANADTEIDSVLVVCPATLRLYWAREFAKWGTRGWDCDVILSRKQALLGKPVTILSYDLISSYRELDQKDWGLVVYDEAHYLKNQGTKRASAAFGVPRHVAEKRVVKKHYPERLEWLSAAECRDAIADLLAKHPELLREVDEIERRGIQARRMVFATGTPIPNRPVELWPLLQQVDPSGLGKSYYAYTDRYCDPAFGFGRDVRGASNLDELQLRLRSTCMIRRLKQDVLPDLPARMPPQVIEISASRTLNRLCNEEWAIYEQLQDPAAGGADKRQLLVSDMSTARLELGRAKVPAIIEHIETLLDGDGKYVVMAHHRVVIEALSQHFTNAAVLVGGDSAQKRQAAVDRFQTDPECRLFIGSLHAAGVGITLTASGTIVFAEQDWALAVMKQAQDRVHRIGQKNTVIVQYLVVEGSLDSHIARTLAKKEAVVYAALDAPIIEPTINPDVQESDGEHAPEAPKEKTITLPAVQIAAIHNVLRLVAGKDPDHALEKNGVGFSRFDGPRGHALAAKDVLSDVEAAGALQLVRKYRRQIPPELYADAVGPDCTQ